MASLKRLRIEDGLVDGAAEHLEGEPVLALFRGQTVISPIFVPIISSLTVVAKPRAVLVTRTWLVTVQQSLVSQSTVARVVSRHPRRSAAVTLARWSLQIADDPRIYALPSTLAAMRDVARSSATARA